MRYADGVIDRRRGLLLAVCEDHGAGAAEPVNTLVRIPLEGDAVPEPLPCAHLEFPGEAHGFRQAATIRRALAAELAFFAVVLGIRLADPPEPLPLVGWPPPASAAARPSRRPPRRIDA